MEVFFTNPFYMDSHIWTWCQEHGCPYVKLKGESRINVFSFLACSGTLFHPQTGPEYYYLGTFYVWRGLDKLKRVSGRALKSTSRHRNLTLGLKYWRLGARLNEVACLGALGNYYTDKGRLMVARNYFSRGTELGNSSCIANLATILREEGRERAEIETLYRQASELGNCHAMEHLADYSTQEDQFITYHQMAIRHGNERSFEKLRNYFSEHLSVPGIHFVLKYKVHCMMPPYLRITWEKPQWLTWFPQIYLNDELKVRKKNFVEHLYKELYKANTYFTHHSVKDIDWSIFQYLFLE